MGVDKGNRHRDSKQDARPLQRDNDREIRPGASDERYQWLWLIEIDSYFFLYHFSNTFGDTLSVTFPDTFGDTILYK